MTAPQWLRDLLQSTPVVCDAEADQSVMATVMSVGLVVGMVVSYLPQHYKIIRSRTSDGLSVVYLLLGALSMTAILVNTLVLQFKLFECCRGQAASVCAVNLLGIVQLVVQFVCFYLIVLLYFIFFPRERRRVARAAARGAHAAPGAEDMPSTDVAHATLLGDDNYHGEITAEWRRSLVIGWTLILFNVVVVAVSALLLFNAEVTRDVEERQRLVDASVYWANGLGLLSMCITFFQYLPQILHTYHAKTVGAVSIPTMLIQVPGSYLMVYTLAVRPGVNASTWVSFLVSGTLQLVLCVLCVYYHRKGGYRRLEAGTTSSGFALAEEEDVGSFGGDGDAGLSRGTSRAGSVDDKERLLGGSGDEARSHDAMGNFLSVPSRPAALSTDTLTLMLSQSPPVGVAWRDTDESATTTVARTTPEQNCDA